VEARYEELSEIYLLQEVSLEASKAIQVTALRPSGWSLPLPQ